jgi:hypothetical protein
MQSQTKTKLSYLNHCSLLVQSQIIEFLDRVNSLFIEVYQWNDTQLSELLCLRKDYDSLLINSIDSPTNRRDDLKRSYLIENVALYFIEYQIEYLHLSSQVNHTRYPIDFNNTMYK